MFWSSKRKTAKCDDYEWIDENYSMCDYAFLLFSLFFPILNLEHIYYRKILNNQNKIFNKQWNKCQWKKNDLEKLCLWSLYTRLHRIVYWFDFQTKKLINTHKVKIVFGHTKIPHLKNLLFANNRCYHHHQLSMSQIEITVMILPTTFMW